MGKPRTMGMASFTEVCRMLGKTHDELREMRATYPDAPAKHFGKESLYAWAEFITSKTGEEFPDLPEKMTQKPKPSMTQQQEMDLLKLEEQKLKNKRIEKQVEESTMKIKLLQDRYIHREEVEKQLVPLVSELMMLIGERDVELRNFCIVGRTAGEIRQKQEQTFDELCKKIRSGTDAFITAAQSEGTKDLEQEQTRVNSPGAGRPKGSKDQKTRKPKTTPT